MEYSEAYHRQYALMFARQDLGDNAEPKDIVDRAQEYLRFLLGKPMAEVISFRERNRFEIIQDQS